METKVPFYNVVNILLPGLVFIGSSVFLFFDEVKGLVIKITALESAGLEVLLAIASLAIAYESGYIIFRLGALFIEPLLKKMFGWVDYGRFVAAQKAGAKSLEMYSREYGFARTHCTLFIALAIITGMRTHWVLMVLCMLCVVLFTLTTREHINRTIVTVNHYLATSSGKNVADSDCGLISQNNTMKVED